MVSVACGGTADRIAARILFKVLRAGCGTPARYSSTFFGAPLPFATKLRLPDFTFFMRAMLQELPLQVHAPDRRTAVRHEECHEECHCVFRHTFTCLYSAGNRKLREQKIRREEGLTWRASNILGAAACFRPRIAGGREIIVPRRRWRARNFPPASREGMRNCAPPG